MPRPGRCTPGTTLTHCTGGWVSLKAGLHYLKVNVNVKMKVLNQLSYIARMMKEVVELYLEFLNLWQWTDLNSHFPSCRKSPSTHSTGGSIDHTHILNTAAMEIFSSPVIKLHSSDHPAPSLVITPNKLREFIDINTNFKTKTN
jgi:hypothetical protein